MARIISSYSSMIPGIKLRFEKIYLGWLLVDLVEAIMGSTGWHTVIMIYE